jgi:hypothetical protein
MDNREAIIYCQTSLRVGTATLGIETAFSSRTFAAYFAEFAALVSFTRKECEGFTKDRKVHWTSYQEWISTTSVFRL